MTRSWCSQAKRTFGIKKADDDKATEANPNERLYRLLPEQPGDKVNADGELLELWNLYAVRWFREQYGTNTGAL